jgi:D-3-phosphoglycerate dehydrogenase / 2-oxoglutarate reductase
MKKIKCLNAISKYGTDNFTKDYELTDDINEACGILVRSAAMKEMVLPEGILAVARAGAGVNNIPLAECADKGIVVFNTPGANANGVKELVLCGMLIASRDIIGGVEWTQTISEQPTISKDVEKGKKAFAGNEIKGKTLGVIGLGAVGAEVANAASALGMKVLGYDPYISVNAAWRLSRKIQHVTDLSEIYGKCDYITVHVPLTDDNKGMIGKDEIAAMKDGVVVLNFARDLLVDDDAMAEALLSGKVRKYVTDFPNTKSVKMKGCIAIPHLGASTEEAEDNCAAMAVEELMDYLDNGNIRNSVNFPACDMGECKTEGRVAVMHQNIPNMIGQITGTIAKSGINISDLTNKSRDKYAYTLLDLNAKADSSCIEALKKIDGVLRVRIIK